MPPKALEEATDKEGLLDVVERDKPCCTDCLCLLLFFAALTAFGALSVYGYTHGNSKVLVRYAHGKDWKLRLCGVDDGVKEWKRTMYTLPQDHEPLRSENGDKKIKIDLAALQGVCVKKCPKGKLDGSDLTKGPQALDEGQCPPDSKDKCHWYGGQSHRLAFYCIDLSVFEISGFDPGSIFQDVKACWMQLAVVAVAAILVGLIFLGLVHQFGACIVWIFMLVAILLPAAAGALFFMLKYDVDWALQKFPQVKDNMDDAQLTWAGAVLSSMSALLMIVALCWCSCIRGTTAVITATADFLTEVPSQMLQPLIFAWVQFVTILGMLVMLVFVASVGVEEGHDNSECLKNGDFKCLKFTDSARRWGLFYTAFMWFWLSNLIDALDTFGTSYAVGAWYFSPLDPDDPDDRIIEEGGKSCCDCRLSIRGVMKGLRYTGSLAYGSLLIAICQLIKLLLSWAKANDPSADASPVINAIYACVGCIVDCVQRFLEHLNDHVYTVIALRGTGFCESTGTVIKMAVDNPGLFLVVGRVAHFIQLLGTALMCVSSVYVMAGLLTIWPAPDASSLQSMLGIAGVLGAVIGCVMMQPFSAAARATMHCYCIDKEISERMGHEELQYLHPSMDRLAEETDCKYKKKEVEIEMGKIPSGGSAGGDPKDASAPLVDP